MQTHCSVTTTKVSHSYTIEIYNSLRLRHLSWCTTADGPTNDLDQLSSFAVFMVQEMRQNCDQIPHTSSFPHLMGQWVLVGQRHCSLELWLCASSPLHRCFPLLTRTLFTHTEEQHCFKCEECRPPAAGTDRPRSPCLFVCIKPHCIVYSTQAQGTAHGFNITVTFRGRKEPCLVL